MCKYFQQLDFLSENISNKETISNISTETNLSDNYRTPLSPIASPRILPLPTLDESSPLSSVDVPRRRNDNGKNKAKQANAIDEALMTTMDNIQKLREAPLPVEDDIDVLFCKSIAPILSNLPPQKNRLAKLKIQTLLYELEVDCQPVT